MKKTVNRTLSLLISMLMILSCISIVNIGVTQVSAASNESPNYTSTVKSYDELKSRLEALKSKYVGTYWTTNGSAANSSGSTSKYYYGIQCKGFASYIFNDLFCGGYIGAYDSNKYYIPNANGATLVDKSWNFSSSDTNTVKNILSKGDIGDFIQVRRRDKTYGHSMILAGKDDNGIWIFDCNSDGKCGVKYYYQNWATFASKNVGMSLYHSTKYPSKAPSYADIGTNFYAYLINTSAWKMAAVVNDNVQLQSENAYRNQIWYFERESDKSYKITNVATGKCLDVYCAGNTSGTNVSICENNGNTAQRWYFTSKDGNYVLHPKHATNMSLDVSDGSKDDGANIQIWETNGTAAQIFTVWKFDNKPDKPTVKSSSTTYNAGSNVEISWGENAFATWYHIDIWLNQGNGGEHIEYFDTNTLSYTIKNVKPGKYGVYVTSCNSNGSNTSNVYNFYVSYTISYNMNGGSGSIGNQNKIFGQDLTLSGTKPTRAGYDFVGWNTNKSATTAQYQAGGKYTANSGATLYAIWKAKQIKVTFYRNQNGSDNTTASQTFTYNVSNQSFSNKNWTKDGYTLLGWSFDRNATSASYGVLSSVANDWINQNAPNKNLYAVWKANTYTVSYNINGGSGSIGNQTKIYGQDLTLSGTKPTRTGYDFVGWNTNKSATTAQYQAGGKYTVNSGATLYAIWKEIGYVMSESEGTGQTIPNGDYYIVSGINQDYFIDIPGDNFDTANGTNVKMWIWDSLMPRTDGYDCFHFE